jgi:hypothetical protein
VTFWAAAHALVEHELAEALKQEEADRALVRGVAPAEQYQVG